MRNLFALVGAGTIAFVGLGWYLDWYKLSRQPAPQGTQRLTVDLNPDKIIGDAKKGIERGGEIIDRLRESSEQQPAPVQQQGPASQFFTPPTSTTQTSANSPWKSLDKEPPPMSNSAAGLLPPRR